LLIGAGIVCVLENVHHPYALELASQQSACDLASGIAPRSQPLPALYSQLEAHANTDNI